MSLLIVAYLFLGGAGAGAFAVLACIDARFFGIRGLSWIPSHTGSVEKRYLSLLVKRGYVVSFAALALGAVCLLADLGRPEIAYMLFTQPTFSYISVGTYSLAALMLCALYFVIIGQFALPRFLNRAKPAMLLIGFVSALSVMTYTGVFLQSMRSIALWNSPWLIVLFVLSALSTGIALVLLCSGGLCLKRMGSALSKRLAQVDLVVIILEIVACLAYLVSVADTELGAKSVERLLVGDTALVFVGGFMLCGLVTPGIMDAISIKRQHDERLDAALACLVLVGGFCLRLGLFEARIHSGT
ncbi:NrfD/PsrC family molybdoenzyme membrane anchor subunit [Raoultibacter phocaeensis]|uniref:NrfD/PsrC family molybdoenzyme membrane anchor subunit n=1 Tax=Raoultibacter phocaeensis TaxID=2479841 RepID=UPI0015D57ABD|nr:NrfD/PsrC family molybdoenzyme membrane anchor subunit [Raoultibacter phocaeensis]